MKSTGAMNGNFAGPHIGFVDDTAHATPMIAMGVRIDHSRNRQALTDMLLKQFPRRNDRLPRHQRVEHDPAGLSTHEGDVGEIEAAHLIDAGDHFIESVIVVQFGLTQQRGVNAVEVVLLVQKLKPLHVPGDMARVRHDLEVFHGRDEAALLLVEIPRVGERQAGAGLLEHVQRIFRWRFSLGMKMPL